MKGVAETTPMMQTMSASVSQLEDTPAYHTLLKANLLTTEYRKEKFEDIFVGADLKANSSKSNDTLQKALSCYYTLPIFGCCLYSACHTDFFVAAGHIGMLEDELKNYIFAQPGMHNIRSCWVAHKETQPIPTNGSLQHGNRVILVVEQGFVGVAFDNGQPVLFPPGLHVWTSETLRFSSAEPLDSHVIKLGPYTLLTVDEGYAAVTQNNGKQQVLAGGSTHLLDHKNWRFEKFLTLKIQTDDLEKIKATSADNITMQVTSTVTWRIVDAMLAATMAAETMATGQTKVSSDITKLRQDVLKQAIASLASFMGGVNYSDSFHMAAKAQTQKADLTLRGAVSSASSKFVEPEAESGIADNPLYDAARMTESVAHANATTMSYGVEILSINILSAVPIDSQLTNTLACGAVASAKALQSETAARGNAKAMRIDAEAFADKNRIKAETAADAEITLAEGKRRAAELLEKSQFAVDMAKMDRSATLIGNSDKYFFGQEPAYLANLVLKGAPGAAVSGSGGRAKIFG